MAAMPDWPIDNVFDVAQEMIFYKTKILLESFGGLALA